MHVCGVCYMYVCGVYVCACKHVWCVLYACVWCCVCVQFHRCLPAHNELRQDCQPMIQFVHLYWSSMTLVLSFTHCYWLAFSKIPSKGSEMAQEGKDPYSQPSWSEFNSWVQKERSGFHKLPSTFHTHVAYTPTRAQKN